MIARSLLNNTELLSKYVAIYSFLLFGISSGRTTLLKLFLTGIIKVEPKSEGLATIFTQSFEKL